LKLKASWNLLETAIKGLFCQLITIPLFRDHKILTQVAGHASHTIKLLRPSSSPRKIAPRSRAPSRGDRRHRAGAGAVWSLGKALAGNALRARG